MPDYISLGLTVDAGSLQQEGRDQIIELAPGGYVIDPLTDWILAAFARMMATVLALAGQIDPVIFETFVTTVLGIQAVTAISATGTATFNIIDTLGLTIDAGAVMDLSGTSFQTIAPLTIAPSANTGDVAIIAVDAGTAANDLSGDATLTSSTLSGTDVVRVNSVTVTDPTDGGVDAEDGTTFNNRAADELPTLSPKSILLTDVGAIARADVEVFRALPIKGLVPPSTTGVIGAVAVALQGADGQPVSSPAKTRVQAVLNDEDNLIVNVIVNAFDPTYNDIDIAYTAQCYTSQDPTAMQAAIDTALQTFLLSTTWGVQSDDSTGLTWVEEVNVVRNDLLAVARIPGVRHIETLTLCLHGGSLGTADVVMTGPAALPGAVIISGTVTT